MLLRDCPVGSEVRLVSFCGVTDYDMDYWEGKFVVFEYNGVNSVKNGTGGIRDDVYNDANYQFEIVSQPNTPNNRTHQITLDGVTFRPNP